MADFGFAALRRCASARVISSVDAGRRWVFVRVWDGLAGEQGTVLDGDVGAIVPAVAREGSASPPAQAQCGDGRRVKAWIRLHGGWREMLGLSVSTDTSSSTRRSLQVFAKGVSEVALGIYRSIAAFGFGRMRGLFRKVG